MKYLYYGVGAFLGFLGFFLVLFGYGDPGTRLETFGGLMIGSALIVAAVGKIIGVLEDIRDAVAED